MPPSFDKDTVEASPKSPPANRRSDADIHAGLIHEGENMQNARTNTASYLGQMSGELAALARGRKLHTVAYFLEMARIEAGLIEKMEK